MTLKISNLRKSYGSFNVLHDVDLEVNAGEVHALLGPNGAGKSTLIKCIGGVQPFDSGSIALDGEQLEFSNPSDAFSKGIATIHQHLSLIDALSVSDNLFLGSELRRGPLTNKREQITRTQKLLDRFTIPVKPSTLVGTLPIGTKQLIEIAKAWHRTDVRVLILDEPTAALAEDESLRLFEEVNRMREAGAHIIYTTHRLGEIYRIADRVTVIRDGGIALTGRTEDIKPAQVVSAISGKTDLSGRYGVSVAERRTDQVVLRTRDLSGPRFGPVSLDVKKGEILGLYGVLGSGRTSLLETITGHFQKESGEVLVNERQTSINTPRHAVAAGLAFVPSDRPRQALWATLSAADNLLMPSYNTLTRGGLRRKAAERREFARLSGQLELMPPDPDREGGNFSGGNQQKIILGRWLVGVNNLKVLILDEPTQGVDVGARQKIYETCYELAQKGVAVVFSSSDADEVVKLADRVIVLDQGAEIAQFAGDEITESALLQSAHTLS